MSRYHKVDRFDIGDTYCIYDDDDGAFMLHEDYLNIIKEYEMQINSLRSQLNHINGRE